MGLINSDSLLAVYYSTESSYSVCLDDSVCIIN